MSLQVWSTDKAPHPPLEVREHQLQLVADPLRMKIIAEAIFIVPKLMIQRMFSI